MKLKKGDQVIVTAGKDKGRREKIERIFPDKNKVLLPGVNVYKKHLKPKGEKQPGGIVEINKPLPVASVALVCPKCSQPTRVGYRVEGKTAKGKRVISKGSEKKTLLAKERFCRKCQATI